MIYCFFFSTPCVDLCLHQPLKCFIRNEPLIASHDITKLDLTFHFLSFVCIDIYLSIQTHITCIAHDFDALGVIQKIRVIGFLKQISSSKSVHRFGQFSRDHNVLPPNRRNNLSWPLGWGFHGQCTNMYGYTLDKTYSKS